MIYETIVTSVNMQGDVHITPFGIRMQDGMVIIAPYRPSVTLENILATGHAVLNLTDDVRVFAGALTGRDTWSLVTGRENCRFRMVDTLVHKELKLVKVEDEQLGRSCF